MHAPVRSVCDAQPDDCSERRTPSSHLWRPIVFPVLGTVPGELMLSSASCRRIMAVRFLLRATTTVFEPRPPAYVPRRGLT